MTCWTARSAAAPAWWRRAAPPRSPPATGPAWTGSRPVLDAVSGPWVYTGEFGTGARMKYIANLLLAVHTVAAAEAMVLARRSGLDLDLVQATLDGSIAELGHLEPARPRSCATALVSRARAGRHPASHPGADRGLRRRGRAGRSGVHRGQGRLRQGARRRLGRPRHRVRPRSDVRRVRPGRKSLHDLVPGHLPPPTGRRGLGVLREDGTLVGARRPQALGHRAGTARGLAGQAEGVLRGLDIAGAPAGPSYDAAAAAAALAAQGDLRGRQLPPAHARDGRRDPGRGLAAVLLPQGPDHLRRRPARPDHRPRPGPGPLRLGGRTGRRHRYRRPGHSMPNGRWLTWPATAWPTT